MSNVTAFGAFVDIGVHQDGLVHVSELADSFVKDPREVVKAGDVVRVRVKDVDVGRKRIALTMRSGALEAGVSRPGGRQKGTPKQDPRSPKSQQLNSESALAAALRRAHK